MYHLCVFQNTFSSCSSQSSDARRPSNDARRPTKVPSFGGRQDSNKTNRVKGGPNRDVDTLMELQMNKVWCWLTSLHYIFLKQALKF